MTVSLTPYEELGSYSLICFDVDGTLTESWSLTLLSGVLDWFRQWGADGPALALVTNQGGVALRYWQETAGWGDPHTLPTVPRVTARLARLKAMLVPEGALATYVAYAYQAENGSWSPTPPTAGPSWRRNWRKPSPGMLLQAMQDVGVTPATTLFVGDRATDAQAARAAGVDFRWAGEFFGVP